MTDISSQSILNMSDGSRTPTDSIPSSVPTILASTPENDDKEGVLLGSDLPAVAAVAASVEAGRGGDSSVATSPPLAGTSELMKQASGVVEVPSVESIGARSLLITPAVVEPAKASATGNSKGVRASGSSVHAEADRDQQPDERPDEVASGGETVAEDGSSTEVTLLVEPDGASVGTLDNAADSARSSTELVAAATPAIDPSVSACILPWALLAFEAHRYTIGHHCCAASRYHPDGDVCRGFRSLVFSLKRSYAILKAQISWNDCVACFRSVVMSLPSLHVAQWYCRG